MGCPMPLPKGAEDQGTDALCLVFKHTSSQRKSARAAALSKKGSALFQEARWNGKGVFLYINPEIEKAEGC